MPDRVKPSSGFDPDTNTVTPPPPGPSAPSEPVLSAASVVTVVTAILALLAAFGMPLTGAQESAVLGAIAVVAPIVLGLLARSKAWSPFTAGATVRAEVAKALRERGITP
jgi:hypothetical protein